jgi:hypothetical protein
LRFQTAADILGDSATLSARFPGLPAEHNQRRSGCRDEFGLSLLNVMPNGGQVAITTESEKMHWLTIYLIGDASDAIKRSTLLALLRFARDSMA